ncbi:hypothetical protein ATCC90586_011174 [Pythium insidiosum]|nr:hypothetical protein ATCC90586_011174 [Pythium insidiosum]
MIARYDFARAVMDITEKEWIEWFMKANEPNIVDYVTVDEAMKSLKMQTKWPEPESRRIHLQADMEAILDRYNLAETAFDYEQRRLVKYLTDALEPSAFRTNIQTRLILQQNKEYKSQVVLFCAWVFALLKEFVTWEHAAWSGPAPATDELLVRARKTAEEWELTSTVGTVSSVEDEAIDLQRLCRTQASVLMTSVTPTNDDIDRHETRTAYPAATDEATTGCVELVRKRFEAAKQAGLPAALANRMEGILLLHSDAFRAEFGRDPRYGLKLHAKKCIFFAREVKWCGKVIDADGVRHCPERIQGLVELPRPETGADLQQFLCAVYWMRQPMPQFNQLTAGLYKVLEAAMAAARSRKKAKLTKCRLADVGWSEKNVEQLEAVRRALLHVVPLAHPSPTADVCLYTDASRDFWGAVVTQLEPGQLQLPLADQDHRPLAFLSGRFVGAACRWATIEKEAFAIVEATRRLEYLLLRPSGFHLFTDRRNLVFIFNPRGVENAMARYQADKLQSWALSLMAFKYVIEHVPRDNNVWGDLLSRWGAGKVIKDERATVRVARLAVVDRVSPLQDPEFVWPSLHEIYDAQLTAIEKDPEIHDDKLGFDQERVPEASGELQQRLCIVAHAGAGGHRGAAATTKALENLFWWPTLSDDVAAYDADMTTLANMMSDHAATLTFSQYEYALTKARYRFYMAI